MAIQQRFIGMQRKGICFAEMPPLEEITCGRFCFCYVLPKKQKNKHFWFRPCDELATCRIGSSKNPRDPI